MTVTLSILDPVKHPGPRVEPRIISVPTRSRAVWATLQPGQRLIDALDELLARSGTTSAQVELLSGTLAEVAYCYPAIGETEDQPIHYSATQAALGPVALVGGGATVGFRDGERFMHCHAAWFDADGQLRGGHLLAETWIGATGLTVVAHTLDEGTQHSDTDPESRLPVFTPETTPGDTSPSAAQAVVSRVCPNENLFEACAKIMRRHGLTEARVVGSIGSLVGAALQRQSGVLLIDGPATEVALTGRLSLGSGSAIDGQLSAIVIDRHGRVHTGDLTQDNIVAVTVELFIEAL
jgi:predicted DNA-binding protein with PD1-like motif